MDNFYQISTESWPLIYVTISASVNQFASNLVKGFVSGRCGLVL